MAFDLKICLANPCTSSGLRLNYTDRSGTYNATTSPTGYGVPGGPSSPNSFTTYTLNIWFPKSDTSQPADQVVDLLAVGIPTPDADGFYTWSFGPSDLGITTITSGVYYAKAVAQYGSDPDYIATTGGEFYQDIQRLFDLSMAPIDILCECKGNSVVDLYAQYLAVVCGGQCSGGKFQTAMDYFYTKLPQCQC